MSRPTGAPGAIAVWWAACRPRTLAAGIAPVAVGAALAVADGVAHLPSAIFALIGALCLQIATNLHNDYEDFVRGADSPERVGPTRACAAGLLAPAAVRRASLAVFAAAILLSIGLVARGGWPIVAIGLSGIAAGYCYTGGPRPLAYLGLGDLFVLIYFGLAALVGTYYVQALTTTAAAWWLGLGVGALSVAILAVNNLRDRETDARAGKRTLAVRLGAPAARLELWLCVVGAYLVLLPVALGGHPGVLVALLSLGRARGFLRRIGWGAGAGVAEGAAVAPELAAAARLLALYGALVALGLLLEGVVLRGLSPGVGAAEGLGELALALAPGGILR